MSQLPAQAAALSMHVNARPQGAAAVAAMHVAAVRMQPGSAAARTLARLGSCSSASMGSPASRLAASSAFTCSLQPRNQAQRPDLCRQLQRRVQGRLLDNARSSHFMAAGCCWTAGCLTAGANYLTDSSAALASSRSRSRRAITRHAASCWYSEWLSSCRAVCSCTQGEGTP
jgi:hypothetical protein